MASDLPEFSSGSNWPTIVLISVGVLLVVGIGVLVWLGPGKEPPAPIEETTNLPPDTAPKYDPPSDKGYVGSARCAGCHEQISETFKSHPMASSASLIDASNVAPEQLQQARVAGKQRVLDVELHDGVMEHHERMFDADGQQIYDQAVPMLLSIGSGRRAKAYIHQRGDAWFMSPLNWYAQPAKWDLAPDYKPDDDRRFDRRVTDECLSCHTGRMNPVGRSLNRYQQPLFKELSIGCENCHGPGEQHVAFREKHETGTDPIVNPAKLEPSRRESVCNQCHLTTTVRSTRYGRSHFDFRPGQNVEEIWALLDTHLGVAKNGSTRAVNHVQQMRQSRCYSSSEGKFGCISCHDPHSIPAPAERADFYRKKCSQCHQEGACHAPLEQRQQQQNSCVACHMPPRQSTNISHVAQTDHRLLKTPSQPTESTSDDDEEELKLVENQVSPLADWEEERALSIGTFIYLSKADRVPPQTLAKSLLRVIYTVPDDPESLLALGSIGLQNKLLGYAQDFYTRGRALPASEEESLAGLLNIFYKNSSWGPALDCADRLLKIRPGDAKTHALRADILRKQDLVEDSIKAAERALELNPTLISVREWLIDVYREQDRAEQLHAQEELIKRMKEARIPVAPPAKSN